LAGHRAAGHPEAYAAPELRHDEDVDGRADLYSLALIAYEVLSGRRREDASDTTARLPVINEVELVPGRRLRPDLTPGAGDVLRRALARNPNQRYATTGEFVDALEREHDAALRAASQPGPRERSAPRPAVVVSGIVALVAVAFGLTLALSEKARTGLRDEVTVVRAEVNEWFEADAGGGGGSDSRVIRALDRPGIQPASAGGSGGGTSTAPAGYPGGGGTTRSSTARVAATGGTASSPQRTRSAEAAPAADEDGYLRVTAIGGVAVVMVDGTPRGRAPTVVSAAPGRHAVRLVGVSRYTPVEIEVDVASGDTARVDFEVAAGPAQSP
jgi:hypothetical protein